jgi:Predicted metal-binding, possibly nucleic acid-binding protein
MKRVGNNGYSIPIKGMAVGKHHFSFDIGGEFFREYENSEVIEAELSAEVDVVRSSSLMNICGVISGRVGVECDRCLEELHLSVDTKLSLIIKFAKDIDEEGDEIMVVDPSEGELDLNQLFYDTVVLSLPLQRVHNEGDCNPEMVKKLESLRGGDGEKAEEGESPFSVLKNLKN